MAEEIVTVTLQISKDDAEFAETHWQRYGYSSRDDYLNKLLIRTIGDEAASERNPPIDLNEDIPF